MISCRESQWLKYFISTVSSKYCQAIGQITLSEDEVDPYKKPKDLLEVSPKGLVPGLKLHKYTPPRALNESTVILEYLNECVKVNVNVSLLLPISLQIGDLDYRVQFPSI